MITLNDHSLLIPDADGELSRFLQRYQSTQDLRQFSGLPSALWSPKLKAQGCKLSPGIAPRNYPWPIEPRINTLYWPTGATRWGYGLFLADDKTAHAIVEATQPLMLKLGDGEVCQLEAELYALPLRPITSGVRLEDRLWLVPLVDERYWWQFIDADDIEVTSETTWADLLEAISDRVSPVTNGGITFPADDEPDAAYLHPDPGEFGRRKYENIAVLIDAVASSLGRRLVRKIDEAGGVLQSPAAASEVFDENYNDDEDDWTQSAGGSLEPSPGLPEKIVVTFRERPDLVSSGSCSSQFYVVEKSTSGGASLSGTRRVFHSSVYANYNCGGSDPDNAIRLDALAERLTADFSAWSTEQFDHTFNGLRHWRPTGYDNYVEWSFGRDIGSGNLIAQTRVQSLPGDFFSETQLSQDSCVPGTITTPSPSTSTTNTPNPLAQACSGRCKWIWNDAGNYWTSDSDTCETTTTPAPTTTSGSPTSTSSTTTSSTSSTTTTTPCVCPTTTSTSTSTTETPETTTTTPGPCHCIYPTFCGTTDGECTYTNCAAGFVTLNANCQPPTTTTTTATPCDCNTTTTAACTENNCHWVGIPTSTGWAWHKTADCPEPCTCVEPQGIAIKCNTAETSCSIPSTTPAPQCEGSCEYRWVSGLNDWWETDDSCFGPSCECVKPSFAGGEELCGGGVSVPCQSFSPTTPPPDACAYCYPTSSTTSSTTTTPACGTGCVWRSDGSGGWGTVDNNCVSGCVCLEPGYASTDLCESIPVPCVPTTTTTEPPPTTTTSSTTTTTVTPRTTTPEPTTTTPAPTTTTTTTTTTPEPWYCFNPLTCDPVGGEGNFNCLQGASQIPCNGPYATQEECEAAGCPVTTTTGPPGKCCCYDGSNALVTCFDNTQAECIALSDGIIFTTTVWNGADTCLDGCVDPYVPP